MHWLNKYSWSILVAYLMVVFTLGAFSHQYSLEPILISFPLIALYVYWCEQMSILLANKKNKLTKTEAFYRNFFLISYSFLFGEFLSLLIHYNNSDILGWWPIIIYIIAVFGLLYALVFSLIALMAFLHQQYTIVFFVLNIILINSFSLLSYWNPLFIYVREEVYYGTFAGVLLIHLILCLVCKAD